MTNRQLEKVLFIIIPYIEYFYFHSTCIIGIIKNK